MKICIINNLYKPYIKGGAERIVENIIEGLQSQGHDVFLITTRPYFGKSKERCETKVYYIKSFYYHLSKMPKILRLFWHIINIFDFVSYFKIRHILAREKPNLVMTHNLEGLGFLISKAIKAKKIKHLHTLHDMQLLHPSGLMILGQERLFDRWHSKIYQKINKHLFSTVDVVISPSKWLLEEHNQRNFFKNAKKIVAPNPIKYENDKKNNINLDEVDILYVGQIGEYKGVFKLVNTFLKLKEKNEGKININIIGFGEEEKKLTSKIRRENSVKFLGSKTKKEVEEYMTRADFLVVPSLCYENSPTVIYEAASLGLPVIASRIGGITELVHNLGGILFKAGDEKNLEKKIIWAIKNPQEIKKIGERSKKKIFKYNQSDYIDLITKI